MKITSKDISKKMTKKIGLYKFEVGILTNELKQIANHKAQKSFAGLQVSAVKGRSPRLTVAEVAKYTDNMFKWLKKPFKLNQNKDVLNVIREIASQVFGKKSVDNKRLENAVQAVIRNPILRGDYGSNATSTIKAKGFDKLGINTAQLFKSIKAKRI